MSRDYFTYEVIRSALVALGDEMFSALKRAAMSPIIYETLDFAVGATDARGQLICQGNGGTGFLGTLDAAVGYVIARYQGGIEPGDVFITNDPYEGGGTHLSDVTLVLPVFFGGELIAFVANKAHWTEVGGKSPGSFTSDATEIYQEGLQFPNIRLFSKGAINEPLVDLIRANVRLPDQSLGDMWAQIAGLRVGERRLLDLFGRYGRETMLGAIEHLLDYGERMSRRALKGLPKGTFEAEDEIDDDGFGNGPFAVRVKVTITDDEFVADYTGSHPQVNGPINTPATGLRSRVRAIYPGDHHARHPDQRRHVPAAPHRLPAAHGVHRRAADADLVLLRERRVLPRPGVEGARPAHPAPAAGRALPLDLRHHHQRPTPRDRPALRPVRAARSAAGAPAGTRDGLNGQFSHSNGETFNIPIEITEARYGLRVDRYGFHTNDGGEGQWRGGRGVLLEYRVLGEEAFLTINFSRNRNPPWALAGGRIGSGNYAEIVRADGSVERFSVAARRRLARGEVARLVTSSGGGFGDPRARPRERVVQDVKDGYITPEQAARRFGLAEGAD